MTFSLQTATNVKRQIKAVCRTFMGYEATQPRLRAIGREDACVKSVVWIRGT